jgi:hypothetical protein
VPGADGRRFVMRKIVVAFVALAVSAAVLPWGAFAQEKAKTAQEPQFSAEEMAAWQKAATPGPHHKHFAEMAGNWKAVVKMWMQPAAEPIVSETKAVCEVLFDGRYCVEKIEGTMMGMPFQGMSISGYDNIKGKHTMVWIDNMGTGTIYSEGDCSDNCTVQTEVYTTVDPMTGKNTKVKMIERIIDPNKHVLESYMIGDDGKEFKQMEVVYTRM